MTVLEDGKTAYEDGRYFDCEKMLQDAAQKADSNGSSDEQTAELFLEYGKTLSKLAKYETAERYVVKARDFYLENFGVESLQYSQAQCELAMLLYEQFKLPESLVLLDECLEIRKKLFAAPHKDIAIILGNIAEVTWKAGDNSKAQKVADQAIEMQRQTIGEENKDYADTLENRSLILAKIGKVEEAEAGLRKSLAIRQRVLRREHTDIAISLSNLAYILGLQGKREGAEEMLQRAIDIAVPNFGEDSPRTATFVNNLGGFHLNSGNLLEAAKHFERALAIKERVLGKDSPGLMINLNNLAIAYNGLKRHKEAKELSDRAHVLMTAKIATDKRDVDTMIFLADKLNAEKKHDEAYALLEEARQVAANEFGPNSLKVAQILNLAGMLREANRSFEVARDHFVTVLRIQKTELGKKHADVAKTLRRVGNCLIVQGLGDVAELVNQQAHAIEKQSGVEDPNILAMRKALNQRRDKNGKHDPIVLSTMNFLSKAYQQAGRDEEAEETYNEFIELSLESGADKMELAQEISMSAMLMMPMNLTMMIREDAEPPDVDENTVIQALKLFKKATAIMEEAGCADSQEYSETLGRIATAYAGIKQYDKAITAATDAIAILAKKNGVEHWSLGMPLMELERIYKTAGKQDEAKATEQRREALPKASRAELKEANDKMTEALFGSLGKMLGALGTGTEDDGSTPGTVP